MKEQPQPATCDTNVCTAGHHVQPDSFTVPKHVMDEAVSKGFNPSNVIAFFKKWGPIALQIFMSILAVLPVVAKPAPVTK